MPKLPAQPTVRLQINMPEPINAYWREVYSRSRDPHLTAWIIRMVEAGIRATSEDVRAKTKKAAE